MSATDQGSNEGGKDMCHIAHNVTSAYKTANGVWNKGQHPTPTSITAHECWAILDMLPNDRYAVPHSWVHKVAPFTTSCLPIGLQQTYLGVSVWRMCFSIQFNRIIQNFEEMCTLTIYSNEYGFESVDLLFSSTTLHFAVDVSMAVATLALLAFLPIKCSYKSNARWV